MGQSAWREAQRAESIAQSAKRKLVRQDLQDLLDFSACGGEKIKKAEKTIL